MTTLPRVDQVRSLQRAVLLGNSRSIARNLAFSREWIILGLVLLFFPLTTELGAQSLNAEKCHHVSLPKRELLWITSGSWSPSGETLLLVDPLQEAITEVSYTGEILSSTKEMSSTTEGESLAHLPNRPVAIRRTEQGYLVLDEKRSAGERKQGLPGGEVIRLNQSFEIIGSIQIEGRKLSEKLALRRIYDWTPLGPGVLAFADMEGPGNNWKSGVVYLEADADGYSQIFYRIASSAAVCHQYLRTRGHLATLGDTGYILLLDQRPSIAKVKVGVGGLEELPLFPEDFRMRPSFETNSGWKALRGERQATYSYEILESSQMAAGLYSWNDKLYLLAKGAATDHGKTAWWAVSLSPEDGAELSRVRLPTDAPNLTVIPGDFFAFIQKGRVQGYGEAHTPFMDIASMIILPSHWLENSSPSGLDRFARVQCGSLPQEPKPSAGSSAL